MWGLFAEKMLAGLRLHFWYVQSVSYVSYWNIMFTLYLYEMTFMLGAGEMMVVLRLGEKAALPSPTLTCLILTRPQEQRSFVVTGLVFSNIVNETIIVGLQEKEMRTYEKQKLTKHHEWIGRWLFWQKESVLKKLEGSASQHLLYQVNHPFYLTSFIEVHYKLSVYPCKNQTWEDREYFWGHVKGEVMKWVILEDDEVVQRRKARIVEARRGRRREMYRMERSVEERTSRCGRREQDMWL